jgi:hypothetical protein
MSFTTLLSAYLLGGVTFLPLLLIAIIATAWFTFPQVPGGDPPQTKDGRAEESIEVKSKDAGLEDSISAEGAANATFAVLRSYNFQTATSALGTKSGSASNSAADAAGEGAAQESMSVYQSMYRSVFDRSKTALNRNPLTEEDEASSGAQARIRAAASARNVFHIVLRHGHLMLYDSPAELEVRHVISMAHHTVSLSDGDGDDENMQDADLFIKRTAILLKPHASTVHGDAAESSVPQPKPFYLFSSNCSEKEDFYHALVAAQNKSPQPQPLDSSCSIKLQSSIHSNTLTPETRAFNALINRVFLALHRTPFLEDLVREKIEKKISRVAKPAFISYVNVQSIDLGDAGPIFFNPRLKDINISGDMVLSMDLKYTGGVKVVISAVAKLDLGQRFKVRTVDLVLAGSLQRLQGRVLVRIKPPPSNRIWFCFENIPDMDIKIEPIVSSRQITYNWILRTIENRIREVFAETLVKPNWDDVPFLNTHGQTYRGGIWRQQQHEEYGESRPETGDPNVQDFLRAKNEKTMSMPNLPKSPDGSATSSGVQTPVVSEQAEAISDPISKLKRRSVTSLPSQPAPAATERAAAVSKPVRSPSFASPLPSTPSVAVDGSNVDAFRSSEAPPAAKRWIGRSSAPASKRDAVDAVREMNDRVAPREITSLPQSPNTSSTTLTTEGGGEDHPDFPSIEQDELDSERRGSTVNRPSDNLHPNTSDTAVNLPRTPSRESIARTDTMSSTRSSQTSQPRGKALFAATAAATSAARQWTLNAVANRKQGSPLFRAPNGQKPGLQEPIGRGQPLPPIGQPLPGPKSSLWGGSGFAGGSVRRKPVLPARRPTTEQDTAKVDAGETGTGSIRAKKDEAASDASESVSMHDAADARKSEDDEFGAWNENYGESVEGNERVQTLDDHHEHKDVDRKPESMKSDNRPEPTDATSEEKKGPAPPLPVRRKKAPDLPKRPHERSQVPPQHNEPDSTPETQQNITSEARIPPDTVDSQPAIPAPITDTEAETRGTLELEEADGIHVIDIPAESGAKEEESPDCAKGGSTSRKVTMEEVPDESESGN